MKLIELALAQEQLDNALASVDMELTDLQRRYICAVVLDENTQSDVMHIIDYKVDGDHLRMTIKGRYYAEEEYWTFEIENQTVHTRPATVRDGIFCSHWENNVKQMSFTTSTQPGSRELHNMTNYLDLDRAINRGVSFAPHKVGNTFLFNENYLSDERFKAHMNRLKETGWEARVLDAAQSCYRNKVYADAFDAGAAAMLQVLFNIAKDKTW